MPKTAQVVTRTNGVASLENLSKQNEPHRPTRWHGSVNRRVASLPPKRSGVGFESSLRSHSRVPREWPRLSSVTHRLASLVGSGCESSLRSHSFQSLSLIELVNNFGKMSIRFEPDAQKCVSAFTSMRVECVIQPASDHSLKFRAHRNATSTQSHARPASDSGPMPPAFPPTTAANLWAEGSDRR